jgi:short-subunit dehydrogenase
MDKKVILITGASSGFGYITAEQLLDSGEWIVYVAARSVDKMKELESKGAKVLKMDVTIDSDVSSGVDTVISNEGQIDVLLANAGYGSYGVIEEVPLDEIKYQYEVNLFGVARQIKAVLPQMRKQRSGRIITTASLVSNISSAGIGWYASTKHAIKGMCTALRQEVKPFGIDVVMIQPGAVKTGFDSVALDSLAKVEHSEDYKPTVAGVDRMVRKMYKSCPGPESTVKAMIKAVTTKHPNPVYRTTMDSKLFSVLINFMPERVYDFIVSRMVK